MSEVPLYMEVGPAARPRDWGECGAVHYRGTTLIRNPPLLGPYSRTIPRVLWWSLGMAAVSHERGSPVARPRDLGHTCVSLGPYRGTSLIKKAPPPRITIGP